MVRGGGGDGELLGGLAAESVADEVDRVGGVVLGCVGEVVVDAPVAHGVKDVGGAAAAEGDVAGFAVEVVGAEGEAAVDRHALGLVDGGGVAVGDVAGVEVVGGQHADATVVEADAHRVSLRVDAIDDGSVAVADVEAVVVAEAHDLVPGLVRALVDLEDGSGQLAGGLAVVAGPVIEVVDVAAADGDHRDVVTALA